MEDSILLEKMFCIMCEKEVEGSIWFIGVEGKFTCYFNYCAECNTLIEHKVHKYDFPQTLNLPII